MFRSLALLIIILASSTTAQAAPPRSIAGLWYSTFGNAASTLRLKVTASDELPRLEEVTGELVTRVTGSSPVTSQTIPVTGQYLVGTQAVCLNFGEPGANRLYGIGVVPNSRTESMPLHLFRVRAGSGLQFERVQAFWYKGPVADTETPETSPRP